MDYEGNIIRPPSEANSIILQATVGCSHNSCTFCGAYRDKKFRIKEDAIIQSDLDFAQKYCVRQKTLFLADGNALVMPQHKKIELLQLIKKKLPQVCRVSAYANCQDILQHSVEELRTLKSLGLKRLYMGLESGHEKVLGKIGKKSKPDDMVKAGLRVREAGLFLSVTVLLGIGGVELSHEHALATANVLMNMQPKQVAVLTLMVLEKTPLGRQYEAGRFVLPDQLGLLTELKTILQNLDSLRTQFHANHASNYFSLDGRLPRDRERFISDINKAIQGSLALKPEHLRAL